jgi:hypothetical protein
MNHIARLFTDRNNSTLDGRGQARQRHHLIELDVTVPLREYAFHCALAYLTAFGLAIVDHVERVTGRRDHDDYTNLVQPDDPVLQELWHAKSTSEHARKIAADTDLMRQLARNYPQLAAFAKDYVEYRNP